MADAKGRIEKLKKAINKYRYDYHVLNKETISIEALDSLKHELKKLEDEYPELVTPDSPTQRVAGEPLKGFKKITHRVPMLSLEDVFSEEEFSDWEKRIAKLLHISYTTELFSELKFDGLAVRRGELRNRFTSRCSRDFGHGLVRDSCCGIRVE